MRLKRLDHGTIVLAGLCSLFGAASALAQNSGGQWRLPYEGGVRQGVEVRQPQVVVVDPFSQLHNPSFPSFPARPVQFTLVPAILMSDGSIFANFGFGFEPVVRPCNGAVVVGQPLRKIGANGVVLSQPSSTPYTQPVPNQMTASQQMIAQSGSRLSGAAQLACFSRDAAGRVFVFRRI